MQVIPNVNPQRSLNALLRAGAVAITAVALLTGCSGGSANTPSTTAVSVATARVSATATASPTSTSTATVNALVPGFPSKLLPLMPKASVESSSVDKNSKPLATASLVGSITATSPAVVAYYTKAFKAQGFSALPATTTGGITDVTFSRDKGTEVVNLAVQTTGGTATFTLGANVLPASLK